MRTIAVLFVLGSCQVMAGDPSLKAFEDPTERAKYAERNRILVDLDGDGVDDMLLSGSLEEFGTMGGPWAVFLRRKNGFVELGQVWAHTMAISFEPDQARISSDPKTRRYARIWVYLKSSGSNGSLGYYRVGEDGLDQASGITIYPGDGGTDLGRRIYEATFKQSPIPFTIERSTTTEDGKVTWAAIKR
jgi:hypothetical protein